MKDRKKIIDELNNEGPIASWIRSIDARIFLVALVLLIGGFIVLLVLLVEKLQAVITSSGHFILLMVLLTGFVALVFWLLWGRKK